MYRATGDEVPEWVKNEQEQFSSHRDKDGNGYMDNEEVIELFYFRNFQMPYLIKM
jgi:hypothetical protein